MIDKRVNTHTRLIRLSLKVMTVLLFFSTLSTAQAVSLKQMKANIIADLDGNANGYAFRLRHNFKSRGGAGGDAIRPIDVDGGANIPMTTDTRSFIASVTKPISAIAILQLLEANNLPITAKIAPWLPANWVKGPNIGQLSFKQLLRHETGFKQIFNGLSDIEKENWGNDWDGLKWIVKNGALQNASRSYVNANYALMRVMIPALWKASGDNEADFTGITAGNHGLLYVWYVTDHIFEPSGVAVGASCTSSEWYKPQAMGYNVDNPNNSGSMSETSWANCGGHAGLRLSARDLVRIFNKLHNGDLLSPAYRFAMYWFKLGWSNSSNTDTSGRKNKWWHGGAWNLSGNRGYRACVMVYSDGVVASLVVNSKLNGKGACTILKDAYNNAD